MHERSVEGGEIEWQLLAMLSYDYESEQTQPLRLYVIRAWPTTYFPEKRRILGVSRVDVFVL